LHRDAEVDAGFLLCDVQYLTERVVQEESAAQKTGQGAALMGKNDYRASKTPID
jgi:hypothetical protein